MSTTHGIGATPGVRTRRTFFWSVAACWLASSLSVVVASPSVGVTPSSLSSELRSGEQELQALTLSNTGTEDLEFSISSAWVSRSMSGTVVLFSPALPSQGEGLLAPAESAQIDMQFATIGLPAGRHDGEVRIASNDPTTPLVIVPMTLTIDPAPHLQVAGEVAWLRSAAGFDAASAITLHELTTVGTPVLSGSVALLGRGNYGPSGAFATLAGEGLGFGSLGETVDDCAPGVVSYGLRRDELATMAVNGVFSFQVENTAEVQPICSENTHTVQLSYWPEVNRVDCGVVLPGNQKTIWMKIVNNGTEQLEVSSIRSNMAEFAVSLESASVAPGYSVELAVTFIPSSESEFNGVLTIDSDDPDAPVLEIALLGYGLCPDLDGDGLTGCGADCDDTNPYCTTNCTDADTDGICVTVDCDDSFPDCHLVCIDGDGDGFYGCADDCEDANETVFPGAPQPCDGLNNDCSHTNWPFLENTNENDNDLDSYTECQGDCDGENGSVHPGAAQVCDGVNNDCDDPAWPSLAQTNEADDDGDSFSECAGDCDDAIETVYPGAPQLCDRLNNDCSDPQWPVVPYDERDEDGDNFSECEGDCNVRLDTMYPGAPQVCDQLNNDCSDPEWPQAPPDEFDDDGDTFAECEGDCKDGNPAIYPGAEELCNGLDDDCNDVVDDGDWGEDTDGDSLGDLCDNCPDSFNPDQANWDSDPLGNACDNCDRVANDQADFDADAAGDACDNCPELYNPNQEDFDEDLVGDICDNCYETYNTTQSNLDDDLEGDHCDFDDGLIYVTFGSPSQMRWQEEQGYLTWNAYRGSLAVLFASGVYTQIPGSNDLAGRECGLLDSYSEDDVLPDLGEIAFFLVSGVNAGGESGLGLDGDGVPRPNANPCP